MPPVFPVGLAAMAIAIVLSLLVRHAYATAKARMKSSARATLAETGLSFEGDPLGAFTLRGRSSGVDLVLENASYEPRPGPGDEREVVCIVRFAAPLADMIVCRASQVDAIMGALPSAPRVRTGHGAFDARYAVFVTQGASGYRGADPTSAGPWAATPILERAMDLALAWMRVRDANVEIAFARLSVDDVARGLAVAANVARAARGEALVDVRGGFLTPPRNAPAEIMSMGLLWGISGVLGAIVGFVASFFEWFRTLDQEAVCGPGATLLHTESSFNGETSHDFHCSNGNDGFLIALHCLSCVLLAVGIFAIVLFARAAVRRPSRG